ncbi:hypothetical protein C8F04DRAFT_1108099 [Mycena alexandri]|uniref:Uncharacterized protein n=1 Tax=Mycena alexandri TaxID=1745969 RepID=A0AAD6SQQ9_9AGAR|nr:hypothetical protein C8F04DRAFT_1108099 [Mycena alexandri]
MPTSPRTSAFIWAGIFVVDLAAVCIFTASIIVGRAHLKERWYNIVFLVFIAIAAFLAALTSRRWWRVHQTQQRTAGLPMAAPAPVMPSR